MPVPLASSPRKVAPPEEILATPGSLDIDPGVKENPPAAAPLTEVDNDLAEAQRNKDRFEKKTPPAAGGFEPVRFVKNIHPLQIITFKDGTTFRFPNTLFVCDDPALAEKISAVASQYHIVLQ